ncbi:hypothetical protein EYZ11_010160 [Aspergillus tanneri]|uniref:NACHT-NTPase and P-loop NTPases N-terminal domain-containing protein n=1 Tax=Aspergillus tanneri TaxID=1220188 RepID=A0A4S3J631_9EURO|nr:hypothetical protein EYZ11_010160 [Aspergillus tanneri]
MLDIQASEVMFAIDNTLLTLEHVTGVSSHINNADDLPKAFNEVAVRVPLVIQTLTVVKSHVQGEEREEKFCQDVKHSVDECNGRALRLKEIFSKVLQPNDTPRMERYRSAARGRDGQVEVLMKLMLENMLTIAKYLAILGLTTVQVNELEVAIQDISALPSSLPEEGIPYSFYNYGLGHQNVNTGTGDQNNNTGAGYQFNGNSFFLLEEAKYWEAYMLF